MNQFDPNAVGRIQQTVRTVESAPAGKPWQWREQPPGPPREYRVARADEAIAATTDPLTSGSIGRGTVSEYAWNSTTEAWEDTGDNLTAYDFSGAGCAEDDWLQLHRLPTDTGVLWIIAGAPSVPSFGAFSLAGSGSNIGTSVVQVPIDGGQGYGLLENARVGSNAYLTIPVHGWYRISWQLDMVTDASFILKTGWHVGIQYDDGALTWSAFADLRNESIEGLSRLTASGNFINEWAAGLNLRVAAWNDAGREVHPTDGGRIDIEYLAPA